MRHILFFLFLLISIPAFSQNKNESIGFKENKGQIIDQKGKPNPDVKYLLNTNGLNVQIKTNGFSYDVYETKKHPLTEKQKAKLKSSTFSNKDNNNTPDYSVEHIYHRIDIDFVNSNPKIELITEQKSKDYNNYYNIPNKPDGVLMVHQYQQITYKNIYPNIDVVFSIPKDSLKPVEYNFVVHPKGKISDIQLKFSGAETDLADNKIKMQVRFGKMEETLPMSWTEDGKCKKEIAVGYKKIKKDVYGFESKENVSNKTVIIDPVPTRLWGTYYGGAQTDYIAEANNDFSGNLLITGNTFSRNNFTTSGAFITNHYSTQPSSFEPDGYIAKFDANGHRIWGTYLNAVPNDIDVDSDNNIISSGYAYNFNTIGTPGTHKPNKQLYNFDGYVLKLDPSGIRKWGTFYGETGEDVIYSAVIDSNNNIIVTGYTGSIINIATPGTHKATKIDYSSDVFLAKIGSDGQRIWGTYYGGSSDDKALSIAMDENNNIYIVGETFSIDGIAFGSLHQNYLNTNSIDGFIASFDPQGKIIFGTYHGGDKNDYFNKIDYNNQKLLVSGRTFSTSGIATINAPQPIPPNTINSYSAGLFSIFNKNGTLEMGSYFEDVILDSGFDNNGNIFISGMTSKTGIGTSNAYQQNLFNNYTVDSFIVKYKSNYVKDWGTYYGGRDLEFESIIHIDKLNGFIYIAGRTLSDNAMASNSAYQPLINGREDLYIAKFKDCVLMTSVSSNSPICIGKTLNLTASGGTNYAWTGPNGFISALQNPTILNATAANSGQYFCKITGTGDCDDTKNIDVFVGDIISPVPNLTILPTITGDCNTQITTIPTAIDACTGAIAATTASPLSYSLPGSYTIVWNYDDGNGNSANQNQTVTISSQPLPTTTTPQTFCVQQNATLSSIAITGQNIKWYNALTNGNLLPNTSLLQNGTTYYVSQTINGCESNRIGVKVIVEDNQAPIPTLATLPTITGDCTTQITTIPTATDACAGIIIATTVSPLSYSLPGTYTIVWNYDDGNGNSVTQNQTVTISSQPLPTTTSPQTFCIQQNAPLSSIAITGQNIKWYDALTNGNLLAYITLLQNNTTYYASQTINGCESERISVQINIQNTATPTGNSTQTFCASQNPTLNTISVAGTAIKWYDNLTAGTLLSNATPLQDGQTYYASQTVNNCESPSRIAITVALISTLPANNYDELFCDDLNDGTETVDLGNYNSSVISNTTNYNFAYYTSLLGAENETTSSKITNFSNYKLVLGDNKIYVRINSNTPCYAVAELKLSLLSKPIINIQDIVPICENNSVTIDAGADFDNYLWSNGAITQSITVSNPGDFSVTITNNYATISCSSTKNFKVKKSNKATINSIESKDWTDNDNTITVFASGIGKYEYSIDGVNYQDSNQFTGLISGKYTVLVRDKNGCGTVTDEVYLLMYPKFFTPNGDGYNDTWKIKFSDIEEGLTVKIFDRYGKLIKMLDNYTDGWNGTFNGTELPAADYWFIVTRANGTEYKGHFSLKR